MKRNIAIVWGGYSSEYIVSAKSMKGIYSFLDKEKYAIFPLKITHNEWSVELDSQTYPIDKNDFSFYNSAKSEKTKIDFAYITIHGTPGEDGRLQGYFDMLRIPYSTCGMMTSALTFNKYICNKYLKNFGFDVADSIHLYQKSTYCIEQIISELGLPVFVKPAVGGSSFGTTKVKAANEMQKAIAAAFEEADEVIIEKFIKGTEITCGCYKTKNETEVFPITEVVAKNEFFDFDAKYNGAVEEITPARLSESMTKQIQEMTLRIYDIIGAKGIIRIDYIIDNQTPYLLEINTTPGMTETSFIPQQVAAAGLNITNVLTKIIENELT